MPKRLIKKTTVLNKIDKGRTWLDNAVKAGKFPPPVKIGQIPHWLESEVDDWIDQLIADQRETNSEVA